MTILSTVANGDRQPDSSEDGEMVPALAGGGEEGSSLGAAPAVVLQPGEVEREIASEKPEKEPIHQ